MSELRQLVEALRGLDDDSLRSLVATRMVSLTHVTDFYALAEALGNSKSFASQVGSLSRAQLDTLSAIARGEKVRETAVRSLSELQLIYQQDGKWHVYSALLEVLNQHRAFTRSLTVIRLDDEVPSEKEIDRDAGLVAFETMQALTEIIFDLEKHLIREVGRAGVGLPDIKRLSNSLAKPNEYSKRMFTLAARLGLMTVEDGRHRLTQTAVNWLEGDQISRMKILFENFKALCGRDLVASLTELKPGTSLTNWLVSNFPLAENNSNSRIGQILDCAENFGLTFSNVVTSWFSEAVAGKKTLATSLQKHLPLVQNRIILQADLSVIAPGPLPTKLEALLRRFANTESIGLASTYRLSSLSVCHGLETGLTIEEIRETLTSASGSPLPQPVDYLLSEVVSRFGRLIVREATASKDRSVVVSSDQVLLTEIGNDPRLRAFSLTRPSAESLTCRFEPSVIYFGLRECGYIAIRHDNDGKVISPITASETVKNSSNVKSIDADIRRIREADEAMSAGGNDEAITRQVQLAIRNKARLLITVTLANGEQATFDLMPNGIANGRLRGLDRKSQIERTLPLSTITSITLA